MSKRKILIILGAIIALMPFLGFPRSFKDFLYVIAGLAICVFAYLQKTTSSQKITKKPDTFTDNSAQFMHSTNKISDINTK